MRGKKKEDTVHKQLLSHLLKKKKMVVENFHLCLWLLAGKFEWVFMKFLFVCFVLSFCFFFLGFVTGRENEVVLKEF